jgi:hypothetical protein
MKIVFAFAALVLMLFACKVCDFSTNKNTSNSGTTTATPTPAPAPTKVSLKDALPKNIGDFTLQGTYEKSKLEGDDKLLPGAEDVVGGVYKSSSNANKRVQVMVGSYASTADAEAARAKRVPSSKYVSRWTKGNLLYVASDPSFKDKV